MNPALLLPLGLLALLTLAIPVAIHIARRTENRTVQFAALRWLEAAPKPRRSLMIDERLLLAARLLLLGLVALWLAQPVLWNAADTRPVVAIMPGTDAETVTRAIERGDHVVWLAPGFPDHGVIAPPRPREIVSLIRQLDAELPARTPVRIVVPATLAPVDAERPRLSRTVDWTVGAEPVVPDVTAPAPPALWIRHDTKNAAAVRYFRAAATTWMPEGEALALDVADTRRPVPSSARHLIWLAKGDVPGAIERWVRNGGVILTTLDTRIPVEGETRAVWRGMAGEPLVIEGRLGQGRVIRLTRAPEPAAIPQLVEPDFPDTLLTVMSPLPPPARVAAVDHVPLTGATAYDQPPFDLRLWLGVLIALILVAERWLATRRARAVAP